MQRFNFQWSQKPQNFRSLFSLYLARSSPGAIYITGVATYKLRGWWTMQSNSLEQIESFILHPEVRELVGPLETLTVCETKICDLPDPITQQNVELLS